MTDTLSKSIDFLLENAGPVIRYRLRRDILGDLSAREGENLLEEIYNLPLFRLLATYVKPDGYIGSGMHSWDNWRGQVLHETPLQDGECAARLLSYYCIPKTHPFVAGFVAAMRDEETLRAEFSYIPPEIGQYENRFVGLENGNSLMALVYTMQALLGYGDDYDDLKNFQQICLAGFRRVGKKVGVLRESAENIEEALAADGILRMRPGSGKRASMRIPYPTPYVDRQLEADSKNKNALLCDLTFWAVEFLHLLTLRCKNAEAFLHRFHHFPVMLRITAGK